MSSLMYCGVCFREGDHVHQETPSCRLQSASWRATSTRQPHVDAILSRTTNPNPQKPRGAGLHQTPVPTILPLPPITARQLPNPSQNLPTPLQTPRLQQLPPPSCCRHGPNTAQPDRGPRRHPERPCRPPHRMRPFCHSHGGSFRPPHFCSTTALKSRPAMCGKPSGQEPAPRRPLLYLSPPFHQNPKPPWPPINVNQLVGIAAGIFASGFDKASFVTVLLHELCACASIDGTMCQTTQLPGSTPQ